MPCPYQTPEEMILPLPRGAALVALLFAILPLQGQQSGNDLYASVDAGPARVAVNRSIYATVPFGWLGGELVKQNVLEIDVPGELQSAGGNDPRIECNANVRPVRCTVLLESLAFSGMVFLQTKLTTPGTQAITARISSATPDPDPSNNVATQSIEVVGLPDLYVTTSASALRIEPGQALQFTTRTYDFGGAATNVTLTLRLGGGATFTAVRAAGSATTCTLAPAEVVCTHPALGYVDSFIVDTDAVAPDRLDGGKVTFTATVGADQDDFDPANDADVFTGTLVRHLLVTNTNDEGGGSLRQALLDAQQLCAEEWCAIDFRIPGAPENGRFVIQPRSALPEVRGYVRVDGATQKAFGGDTNPDGPEIEINGALAGNAHGLLLGTGCEIHVSDLAVTGFAWPGIEARRGPFGVTPCNTTTSYATVITGNVLRENYRGIVVTDTTWATITDNVLENNRRSGLFVNGGFYVDVLRNRVTGNGASGIFLNVGTRDYFAGGAHVEENEIAGNAESAIARTSNGYLTIRRNSMHDNGVLGIDLDLDLVTPNRPDDGYPAAPNAPVLFSAQYEPVSNTTILRGHIGTVQVGISQGVEIDVYASDALSRSGLSEGERWLSTTRVSSSSIDADFTIALEGDLRGQYLTATNTRTRFTGFVRPPDVGSASHLYDSPGDTSELSNAVIAQ